MAQLPITCSEANCPFVRALLIQEEAARVGFDWTDISGVLEKVQEEVAELETEIGANHRIHAAEELGDLFFTCLSVARFLKVDPVESFQNATIRFEKRFDLMKKIAQKINIYLLRYKITQN